MKLNPAERIQHKKVNITCDDMRSLSTHCQFEELVVLWIAASLYPRFHVYPLRLARQRRKKGSHLFLIHIATELLPAQDVIELGQRGKETSTFPSRRALSSAWRGLESGRSKELTKTFVSKTQRNYAPFSRESSISGVSPRSFAFRPTSSSTCCSDGYSPAASSRSQRLSSACIFRFCSGAAESYARAVCGSSGIVIVVFAMAR